MTELYLSHHGILGQKWGVRRFQNKDGTRTEAGKKRDRRTHYSKIHKEYDWAGTKVKETRTSIGYRGTKAKRDELDRLAEEDDYGLAYQKFDTLGGKVLQEYIDKGEESAVQLLETSLGDYDLDYVINEESIDDTGEKYVHFSLAIYGNKRVYRTVGDPDYSDDQYFDIIDERTRK